MAKVDPKIGEVEALIAQAIAHNEARELFDGQSGDTDFPYGGSMKVLATTGEVDLDTGAALTEYPDVNASTSSDANMPSNTARRASANAKQLAILAAFPLSACGGESDSTAKPTEFLISAATPDTSLNGSSGADRFVFAPGTEKITFELGDFDPAKDQLVFGTHVVDGVHRSIEFSDLTLTTTTTGDVVVAFEEGGSDLSFVLDATHSDIDSTDITAGQIGGLEIGYFTSEIGQSTYLGEAIELSGKLTTGEGGVVMVSDLDGTDALALSGNVSTYFSDDALVHVVGELVEVNGALSLDVAQIEEIGADAFQFGVASGDPDASSVVLWTHVSGTGPSVTGTYEVSTSRDFSEIVASGSFSTDASEDFTVKVIAEGLEAGAEYFYRFSTGDQTSDIGRTKTLATSDVSQVDLAVFSCANYPAGFFGAYGAAAAENYDAVVHLGDYIYEYGVGGYATENAEEIDRMPSPSTEIVSAVDYSERYQQYTGDSDLQALRKSAPMIMMWDDHETANDSWKGGAENHDPATQGLWEERRDTALEAYFNWNPVREPEGAEFKINNYRSFDFGDLVSLHMLETRLTARDEQLEYPGEEEIGVRVLEILSDPNTAAVYAEALGGVDFSTAEGQTALADIVTFELVEQTVLEAYTGDRAMIGDEQMTWLQDEMAASAETGITWQILGSQTLMANMEIPAELLLDTSGAAIEQYFGALSDPATYESVNAAAVKVPYNLDAWDGYGAEREQIFLTAEELGINLVSIAGDTHNAWMADLVTQTTGTTVGTEFATPGVSAPGLESYFNEVAPGIMEALFTSYVDDLNFANTADRGFLSLRFTDEDVTAEFVYVEDVLVDGSEILTETLAPVLAIA